MVGVGIQLIFVLREVRKTFLKVNGIIESLEKIGVSAQHSFSEITGFVSGLKAIFKVIDFVHTKKNAKSKSHQT